MWVGQCHFAREIGWYRLGTNIWALTAESSAPWSHFRNRKRYLLTFYSLLSQFFTGSKKTFMHNQLNRFRYIRCVRFRQQRKNWRVFRWVTYLQSNCLSRDFHGGRTPSLRLLCVLNNPAPQSAQRCLDSHWAVEPPRQSSGMAISNGSTPVQERSQKSQRSHRIPKQQKDRCL